MKKFVNQNLKFADFRMQDLRNADFSGAKLHGANFASANLRFSLFTLADCSNANFAGADLRGAVFSAANMTDAFLRGTWTDGTNFSSALGLESTAEWVGNNLVRHGDWLEVWRSENSQFNGFWGELVPAKELAAHVNPDRGCFDGCGVSFGSLAMMRSKFRPPYWRCRIEPEWYFDLVVPYNTDGRGRVSRLKLVDRYHELPDG